MSVVRSAWCVLRDKTGTSLSINWKGAFYRKIVVEVKSFVGKSTVQDLKVALGQYLLYLGLLETIEPERELYLAVSHRAYKEAPAQKAAQRLMQRFNVSILVVNAVTEEVIEWINWESIVI